MANQDNIGFFIGNCTQDPELRFTQSGVAVTGIRIAQTTRYMKDGEWKDGDTLFITGNAWRDFAENLAETGRKGDRFILVGRLRLRTYQDRDGNERLSAELELDDAGPSCKWAAWQKKQVGGNQGGGGSHAGASQAAPPPPAPGDVPF